MNPLCQCFAVGLETANRAPLGGDCVIDSLHESQVADFDLLPLRVFHKRLPSSERQLAAMKLGPCLKGGAIFALARDFPR